MDAYEDLDAFYKDVDVAYVSTLHQLYYEYVKSALKHGKHVLCEKPMTLRREEAEELFVYAEGYKLVLAEGIKTAYCPGFEKLLGIATATCGLGVKSDGRLLIAGTKGYIVVENDIL